MKLIAALAVSVMLLMGASDKAAPRKVTAVRHWPLSDVTRVAVEISGPFEFHSDRLHNPERIYFDIPNARPWIDSKRNYAETVSDKLLLAIRVAETTPGTTRVVLDLAPNVEAAISRLANPARLIVELRNAEAIPIGAEARPAVPPDRPAVPASAPLSSSPAPLSSTPAWLSSSPAAPPVKVAMKTDAGRSGTRAPATSSEAPKLEEDVADATPPHASPPPPEEIAKAARLNSSGNSSLIRALGLKINRIVIDPGHGGHDQGTAGPKGLLEKDLVLDVALRVGKLVEDRMGAEVVYTRSDDTFVSLEGRTDLANHKKVQADLFLSIHANSSPSSRISGVETYYLDINRSKEAMELAARENGPSQSSIFELPEIFEKLALNDKSMESKEFAKSVQAALYAFSLKKFPGSKDRGVKSALFKVLIGAKMPSILAEIGFVSNPREEALLKTEDYKQKLAEALYRGMEKYAQGLSHFETAARQ